MVLTCDFTIKFPLEVVEATLTQTSFLCMYSMYRMYKRDCSPFMINIYDLRI